MPIALVTGAGGFIGGHVATLLLQNGWSVRALRRKSSVHSLPHLKAVQWVTGDIRHKRDLVVASRDCDAVFHVAADYRLWAANPAELYESNVQGTVHVLEAALENSVPRVVYTSSVGALGHHLDGTPADELTPVHLEDMIGHYKRSKFLAEREAEKFLDKGLSLVMVHPSTPIGPADHKPTPTGKIIVDFLNGKMPAYLNTGLNLVHVRDVAWGHLLAHDRGEVGEKYILGNRNVTLEEIFKMLEAISGVRAPKIRLPYRPILWLGYLFQGISAITGREPLVPLEGVRMARKYMYFDAGKAVRELSLSQTPIEEALADAVAWFRKHGYAPLNRKC